MALAFIFFGKALNVSGKIYNLYSLLPLDNRVIIMSLIFVLIPSLILLCLKVKDKKENYGELLPYEKFMDNLYFIESYFNNPDDSSFQNFLKLNSDVKIYKDLSKGSNAKTILCCKNNEIFIRKYAFGKDALKLKEQINWLHDHQNTPHLVTIKDEYYNIDICAYDMPYYKDAVTCFNYIHLVPFKNAWQIIKEAMESLKKNIHSLNKRPSNMETIDKYIDDKVLKNYKKIVNSPYIKPLLKYDYIYINEEKYHNLNYFLKYLNKSHLEEIFKNDCYSDIHGDFTIENIIYNQKDFYLIDPNTSNIHESPYLDYAKLLQSIHGGYEFLMNVNKVVVNDNKIKFLYTKSTIYNQLYSKISAYLLKEFNREGLKSIYYHEVIHWLRLMPYKIEKNAERQLIFYAGLIMVLTDVERKFENETSHI